MPIEILNISFSKGQATEVVYYSGGLSAIPTPEGWALTPVKCESESRALAFKSSQEVHDFATKECLQRFIGSVVKYVIGTDSPPMDVWESGRRHPVSALNAADSWGAIAHQATEAGDIDYANSATYVSVCLKIAGLRLRDVASGYHDQLNWALSANSKPGLWFANAALLDLYADFHSLASELSSARDHLARIAAIHCGAPDKIDCLSRLEDWANRPVNFAALKEPLVALLLSASGTEISPNWLRRLGTLRNQMLHRTPMAANKNVAGLVVHEIETNLGKIRTIRLAERIMITPLNQQDPDPLIEFATLSAHFETLCRSAIAMVMYPAMIPTFFADNPA